MHTRRHFIQSVAVATVPATLINGPVPLAAQAHPSEDLLGAITAEQARVLAAVRRGGARGEHFRAAAATLRMLAATDLDAAVNTGLQQLNLRDRRNELLSLPINMGKLLGELRRAGMDVSAADLGFGRSNWTDRNRVLTEMLSPQFSISKHFRQVASRLDGAGSQIALAGSGEMQFVQYDECDVWEQSLVVIEVGVVVLCAMGNVGGCIAAAGSVAVIRSMLLWVGC